MNHPINVTPFDVGDNNLTEVAKLINRAQVAKGFWKLEPIGDAFVGPNLGEKLMLIVSEAAEALEELRSNEDPNHVYHRADGKPEGLKFELADIIIRTLDLAGALGIDIGAAVTEKHKYNETRPFKHGRNF